METEHLLRINEKINSSSIEDEFHCLRSICLSITDYCNLSCGYCPHFTFFENRKVFMDDSVIAELSKQLKYLKFDGLISISGFGEPTLHPNIYSIVEELSGFNLQLISNGLTGVSYDRISKYADIVISMHNKSDYTKINEALCGAPYIVRNHDILDPASSFTPCNRYKFHRDGTNKNVCYYPFYKMMIDYDGSYLLCQEDWRRISKQYNIFDMDIYEYFISYIHQTKLNMLFQPRSSYVCTGCDVCGKLIGERSIRYFIKKYNLGKEVLLKDEFSFK